MQVNRKLIASPLNYTGGKYKLLPQILPLLPDNIKTFVDLFCGGCNVGVNVKAKKVICNDIDKNLIGLFKYFQKSEFSSLKSKIDRIIQKYELSESSKNHYSFYNCSSSAGLSKYNREKFLQLRNAFNSLQVSHNSKYIEETDYYLYLYVLIIYSFNNQIRFNSDGLYNLPVGKRDFNLRMQNKLKNFLGNISDIVFINEDFSFFKASNFSEDDFFYADPPYLITNATYNEKNRWNEYKEKQLLAFLDSLAAGNIKFALSNVLSSNGKVNTILTEWLGRNTGYVCHHLDFDYKNSNYHKKQTSQKADEVLITNY